MPWCAAVGCNNNTFKQNRVKDMFLRITERGDTEKKMDPKHTKREHAKKSKTLPSTF